MKTPKSFLYPRKSGQCTRGYDPHSHGLLQPKSVFHPPLWKKLWLFWLLTVKNLEKFSAFHTQLAAPDTTIRCINELEGLQLYYCKPSEIFVLRLNVIHACICFATSSHTGTWVWALDAMPEGKRLVEWGISWVKSRAGLVELIDRNPSNANCENKKACILHNENALNKLKKLYNICNNKRKRGT